MKIVILVIGICFFLTMLWLARAVNRATFRCRRRNIRSPGKRKMETTKKVIWVCLINGFAWVWCSYILAYLDKTQIAESLSQVAVTEIIGVVLAYCIKSVVENLSKNNHWPDKKDSEPPDVGQ